MSVKLMSKVWDADLPRPEKLVLLCLADFGSDNGESIYPSLGYIAWKTGYKETQARDVLQSLERRKIISVDRRASKYGTNQYLIHVDKLPERPPYRPPKMGRPEKVGAENEPTFQKVGAENEKVGAEIAKVGAETEPDPLVLTISTKPSETLAGAFSKPAPRTDAKKKGDMFDGTLEYAKKAPAVDVSHFPEDVQAVIRLYCELFEQKPSPDIQGSDYALWVQDARLLMQAGGSRTMAALKDLRENPYEWMVTAMIGRPGALIKAVRARAGELVTKGKAEQNNSPEALEAARLRIEAWKARRAAEAQPA